MTTEKYNQNHMQALASNSQLNNMVNYHVKSSYKTTPTAFDYIKEHFFNERVEKLLSKVQLYEFTDKKIILNLIRENKEITNLLRKHDIELEINVKNLESITSAHLNPTLEIAYGIMEELSSTFRFSVSDKKAIIRGAIFHDFGKVLIPDNILNSTAHLNDNERKVVELHAQLGYELLKASKQFDDKTLNLVRNHHRFMDGSGYPQNEIEVDILSQIITAADIYTALREERSYKESITSEKALTIMKELVEESKLSILVYNALKKLIENKSTKQN